ncbi:MAG: hypothetical protein AB8G17_05095 [Gammaproteobacteria bacterium]
MRLLIIAIFCLIIFFPCFWLFSAVVGTSWGGWLATVFCWLFLPFMLLSKWTYSRNPILQIGNYLIAIAILGFSLWVAYQWLIEGADVNGSVSLLLLYFSGSIYFLTQGHLPYQKANYERDKQE